MPPIQPDSREAVVKNSGAALASDVQEGHPQRAYSWEEVSRHNTAKDALVIIDGLVYDITGFMDRHPGGREMMLLSAGRECTDLFRMYHWWDEAKTPRSIMAKFKVGWLEGPTEFPEYSPDSRGFYSVLSARVRQHFEKAYPADPKGATKHPWPALWRLAIMFAVAALCYCTVHGLLLPGLPLPAKLAVAALAGVFQAMPLMHAMHDACHTAMGASEAWWKVFGRLCLDWYAGGCMITWHHQHVIGHHVYTNVFKSDPDLPAVVSGDLRRHVDQQQQSSIYAYQWLYLPVLYGFLGVLTRFQDIANTYLERTAGPVRVNYYGHPLIHLVGPKALWLAYRVLVPLLVLGVPHATFWPCLAVTELATGFYLAWNFEVSHLADGVDFPVAVRKDGRQVLPLSWAESQVVTGVDYAHNSWWEAWWSGALNYQIEHHLFPGISQYHYPAIAGIVKQTSEEFGLKYTLEPTFWSAWTKHVQLLHKMGQQCKEVKLHAH